MSGRFTKVLFAVAIAVAGTSVSANDYAIKAAKFVESRVAQWASAPELVNAVRAQNLKTSTLAQADIDAMDQQWRAEIGAPSQPVISAMLDAPASVFLREQLRTMDGSITEVILMDAVGLNVAVSARTSDMWQGDEAKFTETFPNGPEGIHVGEVELDESTGSYQSQVSFTIVDPETQEPIGAMTIAVRAEELI